jgi:hypothetical protein
MSRVALVLALLVAAPAAAQEDGGEAAPVGVPAECTRAIGGSVGFVPAGTSWQLIGDGPVVVSGSPVLALTCHTAGEVRASVGLMSAPFQRHWYRNGGRGGLIAVPHFGLETGRGRWRVGANAIAMPRLVGGGVRIEHRLRGEGWWVRSRDGQPKGLELRANVLDGDVLDFQLALLYTFGVVAP